MKNKRPDPNSLLIVQDLMDILYKIKRIKGNSYDNIFSDKLNNLPPLDRAESLIRYMSKNNNSSQNAEIFINILRNLEMLNQNQSHSQRGNYSSKMQNSMHNDNDIISKIKFFLKSLNDEE